MKKAGIVDRMRIVMTDGVLHCSPYECEHASFGSRCGYVYSTYGEGLLVSYIISVERNTRYMRHNADWQTHNYPNLREKNWASEVVRSAALKSGIAPEFAGDGWAGLCRFRFSKSPTPLLEACAHSRRVAPLPKLPTRRTKLVTLYLFFALSRLCAVGPANNHQEAHVSVTSERSNVDVLFLRCHDGN